jgi:hypothetical protein
MGVVRGFMAHKESPALSPRVQSNDDIGLGCSGIADSAVPLGLGPRVI